MQGTNVKKIRKTGVSVPAFAKAFSFAMQSISALRPTRFQSSGK